jgi:uncharacterized protein (TIGR00266 family)
MEFEVSHQPSFAILTVTLDAGDRIAAKQGALLSRSASVAADTTPGDDVTEMVSGTVSEEHEVLENVYEGGDGGGHVTLAPDKPGDLIALDVAETGRVKAQAGTVLAWTGDVDRSVAANETSNVFSSGELTVLALDGSGTAFLSAYGGVEEVAASPDDPVVVDEDHLIAWTDGLAISRQRDDSLKSSLLGGDGFVTRFEGDGRVWLHTRDPAVFRQQMKQD